MTKKTHRICDHKGCEKAGEFRAPKDRKLKDYYWFCQKHVAEYNKNWNFYKGMTIEEVEEENKKDTYGHRPTKRFGGRINPEMLRNLDDPFSVFEKIKIQNTSTNSPFKPNSEEEKALLTIEIEWPFTGDDLKKRFKELVKKYHPDATGGDKKKEERFKKINHAYQVLVNYFKSMK